MRLLKQLFFVFLIFSLSVPAVSGVQTIKSSKDTDNTVKIGLLIPDQNSLAAQHGAEMAILEANRKGGLNGKPFQLVVRSMEGPWGTGSKMAVDMLFEDKVWAIMGSHDGRNAHLVEQACTKVRAVFLSTWAGDPTLSKAFVPWYFSTVPNDLQQADALIEEIYNEKKFTRIVIVSDNSYDSRLAMASFMKKTRRAGKSDPVQFIYNETEPDFTTLLDQINKADTKCIVLFGKPLVSIKIIRQMRQRKMNQSVFGSLSLLDENEFSDQDLSNYEGAVLVSSSNWTGSVGLSFRNEFWKKYGRLPGDVAAYAYDGMCVLIEAIKTAGPDRVKIQKALTKTRFEGITGLIQFDEKGNRMGKADLIKIRNGVPVTVQK